MLLFNFVALTCVIISIRNKFIRTTIIAIGIKRICLFPNNLVKNELNLSLKDKDDLSAFFCFFFVIYIFFIITVNANPHLVHDLFYMIFLYL